MTTERRPYGVHWGRLVVVVGVLAALNLGALALATVDAPLGLTGHDLIGVAVAVSEPTSSTTAPPPALTPPPGLVGREERGRPQPGGVRGIVFSPDGRTGWQFPRHPSEGGRGVSASSPTPTVVRPLALPRAGLDGMALYLATLVAMVGSGLVVLLLAPERVAQLSSVLNGGPARLARLLAIGAVAYVGAVALGVLLVVIVTGVPLAMALAVVVSVATILGVAGLAVALGSRLLAWARLRRRRAALEFLVGMLVLAPMAAVPLVGWLFAFIMASLGLGATLITRFGVNNPFAARLESTL